MVVANRGYVLNNVTADAALTITLDPSAPTAGAPVEPGDQVFAVVVANAQASNTWEPPGGWVDVQPEWGTYGTFYVKVYHRTWQAGDTAPTFTLTGAGRWLQGCAFWLSGAAVPYIVGVPKARPDVPAETQTCTAPGVVTPSAGCKVVSLAFERTSAAETAESITVSGAEKWFTLPQPNGTNISTVTVATLDVAEAGQVGNITTTYPNTQGTNGWAFQIALPPLVAAEEPVPALVREWGGGSALASNAATTIPVPADIPAGHHVFLAATSSGAAAAEYTVTDSKGNTWTHHRTDGVTGTTTRTTLQSGRITTPLTPADTITLTPAGAPIQRLAWSLMEFDRLMTPDQTVANDNGGASTTAVTTGVTPPTTTAPELLVGAFGLVNSPRNLTPGVGVVAGTKHVSTVGTGERASQLLFGRASATGPQSLAGTLDTGGLWSASLVTFSIDPPPAGLPVKVSDGVGLLDGRLMVSDGDGTLMTPGAIRAVTPGFPSVAAMLATPAFKIAHRGGSVDFPEMSLYAYGQSALRGYKALELSLGRTSDGVLFGLHDSTLDRTSGTTGAVASTLTWAQVQTHQIVAAGQPPQPYMRLDELLDLYGSSHVIFVDHKYLTTPQREELLDVLAAVPGATDRIVVKYYGVEGGAGNTGWAAQARARGFKTWGYFYEADLANLDAYQDRWDILGMDYAASQAAWDAVRAYGKPVIGHICPGPAAVATAISKGANGCMVSAVAEVAP